VVRSGSLYGCQFHPEKSGEVGLAIVRNFLRLGPQGDEQ
jgi:glutamine amidotransferase